MVPKEIRGLEFKHFVDEGEFRFGAAEARESGKLYLFRISNTTGPVEIYKGGRFISLSEELACQVREAIARAEDVPTFLNSQLGREIHSLLPTHLKAEEMLTGR